MNTLIEEINKSSKFTNYITDLKNKISPIVLSGLSSVGKIQLVEATKEYQNTNILLITYNEIQAKRIVNDLKYFSNEVIYFPKREIAPYDYDARSKDLPYERICTLNKLYEISKGKEKKKFVVVTTMEALMQKMLPKEELYSKVL